MFLALVHAAAIDPSDPPLLKQCMEHAELDVPAFSCSETERQEVRDILARRGGGPTPKRLVLLNPNCSDLLPLRRWPTARFVELGRRLLAAFPDTGIVITGAPDEKDAAEKIAAEIGSTPRVISMAGHTTMRQLLVLYGLSEVLVSNDSGPCHFAALAPLHVVALFGPETPLLYGPLGKRARSLSAGLACSPCVNILNHRFSPCHHNRCMDAISVDQVFAATAEAMGIRRTQPV
jgi:ADP-heptose:LPS heptosyltransferase